MATNCTSSLSQSSCKSPLTIWDFTENRVSVALLLILRLRGFSSAKFSEPSEIISGPHDFSQPSVVIQNFLLGEKWTLL